MDKILERIRLQISYNEIPQREIAKVLGVSQPCCSYYLNGKRKLTAIMLKKLCEYLHCSSDYILWG